MWNDAFSCTMTHSQRSSVMCEITHSHMWNDAFSYTMTHSHAPWLVQTCHDSLRCAMTYLPVIYSYICVYIWIYIVHLCYMNIYCSYIFLYIYRRIHLLRSYTRTYFCHMRNDAFIDTITRSQDLFTCAMTQLPVEIIELVDLLLQHQLFFPTCSLCTLHMCNIIVIIIWIDITFYTELVDLLLHHQLFFAARSL